MRAKPKQARGLDMYSGPPETLRGRSFHPRPVVVPLLAALFSGVGFCAASFPSAAEGFSSTHNVPYVQRKSTPSSLFPETGHRQMALGRLLPTKLTAAGT
jgi:hypothetical protein